jgi:hypothetical protein
MNTSHIDTMEGLRESYETEALENSNLRKLLFEAVKRLDAPRRLEIIAMVKDKALAKGGFTSTDWGSAEEFDEWKKLFDDCANMFQSVIDAPNLKDVPHGILLMNDWFMKADALAERCRSHGIKLKREKTLEELLDNKDH